MTKRFIEYDLPLEKISEESAREKNIRHGHPSTLHIWWARRPLASSRATAFAALLDDPGPHEPEKRREIKRLIEQITPWGAVKDGNSPAIERAREMLREQYGRPPRVLDPFSGGGSIPLEALRLGCETYASDYNPVAVFVEKATLEWPQRYGVEVALPSEAAENGDLAALGKGSEKVNLLAYLVEKWANRVLEEARAEIGEFYPEEKGAGLVGKREITHAGGWIPVGYLWARTIPCQNPTCGAEIPLVGQFWLAKKKDKQIAYRPVPDRQARRVDFELLDGAVLNEAVEEGFDPGAGTVSRGNARCPVCGQVVKAKQTRQLARDGKMGERLVAVVLHHPKETGKKYRLAADADRQVYDEAVRYLGEKLTAWPHLESPLPDEPLPPRGTLGFRVNLYGMERWHELFNARQKLVLMTLLEKIKNSHKFIEADCQPLAAHADVDAEGLAKAVVGYLSMLFDRFLRYSTNLCIWDNTTECVMQIFNQGQSIPMRMEYMEQAPFAGAGAALQTALERIILCIYPQSFRSAKSSVRQFSAVDLELSNDSLDAILTDPPYYDNIL